MRRLFLFCCCLGILVAVPFTALAAPQFPDRILFTASTEVIPGVPVDSLDVYGFEALGKFVSAKYDSCDTVTVHWYLPPEIDCTVETYHIIKVYIVNLLNIVENGDGVWSPCDFVELHFKTPPELNCMTEWYHVVRVGTVVEDPEVLLIEAQLEEPTDTEKSTWGWIKSLFR